MRARTHVLAAAVAVVATATAVVVGAADVQIDHPSFHPTEIKADFIEQFTDSWGDRWFVSSATKKDPKLSDVDLLKYSGSWKVELPTLELILGDKGLVLQDASKHHAISAKFPHPIDPSKRPFVVQYEVQLQDGLECGGAYLKLLTHDLAFSPADFENSVPYTIMFGPDKCGQTNKVHFIVRKENPITGEIVEHQAKGAPPAKLDKLTHLYTLIITPEGGFEIRIDQEPITNGTFALGFTPSIIPPKEIPDETDEKPDDWVDDAKIPDPDAVKPADWDEDEPKMITDEKAVKPDDWLEDEPLKVPDPEAKVPEDWDEDEDGEFVAPLIANPKCAAASGCGTWTRPMIPNPKYKGKWTAPLVPNPDYKGVWEPKMIPNPAYYDVKDPANLSKIGAIGFELWTLQRGILFDNIYVGHSIEDAERFAEETWVLKHEIEKKAKKAVEDAMPDAEDKVIPMTFTEKMVSDVFEFIDVVRLNGIAGLRHAVTTMPHVAGAALLIVVLPLLVIALMFTGPSAAVKKTTPVKAPATKAAAVKKDIKKDAKKAAKESDEDEDEEDEDEEEEEEEEASSPAVKATVTSARRRRG